MRNDNFLQYLHLHGIVFIWGFTAVLGALITIDAIPLVWYRMLLASTFIAIFDVGKITHSCFRLDSQLYNVANRLAIILVAGIFIIYIFFLKPNDVATSLKHLLQIIRLYFCITAV